MSSQKIPKRIFLVPVDGSADSRVAAERAAELARAENHDEICLLHVVQKTGRLAQLISNRPKGEAQEEDHKAGEEILDFFQKHISKVASAKITTYLYEGEARDVILQQAQGLAADYIFMGCRGKGMIKSLMGSVSFYIAQHAECAVMTVRDKDTTPVAK